MPSSTVAMTFRFPSKIANYLAKQENKTQFIIEAIEHEEKRQRREGFFEWLEEFKKNARKEKWKLGTSQETVSMIRKNREN